MVAKAAISHCNGIGDEVLALTHSQLDISDRNQVIDVISSELPDAVMNCAAFTDVDAAETRRETAHRANVLGPENLASASKDFGSRFLTISTDYVFNGRKTEFYTQQDQPDPESYYAKTKFEGELRAFKTNEQSLVVRTGWIFGEGGSNFLSIMSDLLENGQKIKAISDSFGSPTYAKDLVVRMRELIASKGEGVFHVVNSGGPVSFYDFAVKISELVPFDRALIEAVFEESLKRPAKRPRNSALECVFSSELGFSPLPDWRDALDRFLSEKRSGRKIS